MRFAKWNTDFMILMIGYGKHCLSCSEDFLKDSAALVQLRNWRNNTVICSPKKSKAGVIKTVQTGVWARNVDG